MTKVELATNQLLRYEDHNVYASIIRNRWGMFEVGIERFGRWIVRDFSNHQDAFDFILKYTI